MPGQGSLVQVRIGESARHYIPAGMPAIRVIDAAGTSTVVIDKDGALNSALTATALTYADDVLMSLGTGNVARMSWDTTDANGNALFLQLPAGGAVDVPVIVIGQSIESVDLGLYNGVTEPRIAIFGVGAVTTAPVLEFRKARGSIASPTVVTSGDDLGSINFHGAVAAGEYVLAASIRADMAGTIATTRGPGTLTFLTATDAAPSVLTAALTLGAAQEATIGGALTVTGTATFNDNLVLPAGTDLTFTGTTGTNDIVLTNGLADALSITDGAADVLVIDTSTSGNVVTLTAALDVTGAITGTTSLALGVAGGATGDLIFNGTTSGVVTLTVNDVAGTWTMVLPAAVGTSGQQLTDSAGDGVTAWAAASLGAWKNDLGVLDPEEALKAVVSAPTHVFTYKTEVMPKGQWDGNGARMTGIFAEEAPWAMHGERDGLRSGIAFSNINAFGYARAAIQALNDKIARLEQAA
ncbi:MAG: hypothetical protein NUW01_05975 [Gemmatimonadaceae bacterium]|nr:hypothetical protein [Gemmatimonadaceae bacterium]